MVELKVGDTVDYGAAKGLTVIEVGPYWLKASRGTKTISAPTMDFVLNKNVLPGDLLVNRSTDVEWHPIWG